MSAPLSFAFPAELSSLADVLDQIDRHGQVHDWPGVWRNQIRLVVEELVMNALSYGDRIGPGPAIRLTLTQQAGRVVIDFADDGAAFDPLQLAAPDVDATLDERRAGGLGVYLVRQMVDAISYRRAGGQNHLHIVKVLSPARHTQ
ncbi:MAG: hypothetical protein RLZZ401_2317 [Pseudomonadota bacterium]|jgi:anti-sigma regulatory factor (Ser/Thr protein kinase)